MPTMPTYPHSPLPARRVRSTLMALVLLCCSGAAAAETLDAALHDLEQHGYASPLLAMQRLQAVTDKPDAAAPVEQQLRYHSALALLAINGKRKPDLEAAIGELKRLTGSGRCEPCAAHVLALRIGQADVLGDRASVKPLVEQLAAVPPMSDARLETERLGMLARGRAMLEEHDAVLILGAQSVNMAGRSGLPAAEARLMNGLVRAHFARGDMASALTIINDCYVLAERIGFRFMMAQARINQNYAYGTLKQEDKANAALIDALRITNGTPGTEKLEQIAQTNLSAHYINTGRYEKAIRATHMSEKLAREINDNIGVAFAISNRGSATARLGQVDEGMAMMKRALEIAESVGDRRIVLDLLSEQVNVLERAGRDKQALATLRRVFEMSDAITSSEREKAVLELQEKFSAERKTREIERLSLSNTAAQAEVSVRAWQQRLWAAVAVALLLSTALLVLWIRTVRRRNQTLVVDNAALTSQSIHDPLTGAFNRRHFEQLMSQQEATVHGRSRDRSYQAAVGLILLDVDHFKRVNDTYGHSAGDEVLKVVAERLRTLVREQDAVVRWGGEEFVLVLPGTPPEGLPVVAAKALHALGREPVLHDGHEIAVRASAGAIAWPAWPGQEWADALHVADLALYLSKTGGRNRASCVKSIVDNADLSRVHADLGAAVAAGDVELHVVSGPAH